MVVSQISKVLSHSKEDRYTLKWKSQSSFSICHTEGLEGKSYRRTWGFLPMTKLTKPWLLTSLPVKQHQTNHLPGMLTNWSNQNSIRHSKLSVVLHAEQLSGNNARPVQDQVVFKNSSSLLMMSLLFWYLTTVVGTAQVVALSLSGYSSLVVQESPAFFRRFWRCYLFLLPPNVWHFG